MGRVRAIFALQFEFEALIDTEALLLVDDDERQVVKANLLLKERVRAHHHLRIASRDPSQQLESCAAENRSGQSLPELRTVATEVSSMVRRSRALSRSLGRCIPRSAAAKSPHS